MRCPSCLLASVVSLLLIGGVEAGVIYDLADDYSSTVNTETSTWSYRFGSESVGRDGNYALLATPPGSGQETGTILYSPLGGRMPVWNANSAGVFPFLGKNETGVAQSLNGASPFVWQPEAVIVHPNGSQFVVASWLSPLTGVVDLTFEFSDPEPGGDGVTWYVEVNDQATTLDFEFLGSGASSGLQSISGVSVVAGDRINFIVESTGDLFRDTTRIEATVEAAAVPEPSASLLLAVCGVCLGILWCARRGSRLIGSALAPESAT